MGSFWISDYSVMIVYLVLVIFYLFLSRVSNKNQRLDRLNLLSTYHVQSIVLTAQIYRTSFFSSRKLSSEGTERHLIIIIIVNGITMNMGAQIFL